MKTLLTLIAFTSLISLSGCAAGSATAAYALRAQTADNLTAEGEARIVERTRMEIMRDFTPCYNVAHPTN